MKTILIKSIGKLFIVSFILFFASCSKEEAYTQAEVAINCTGVYILTGDKTYLVCNEQTLKGYKNGERIQVDFSLIGQKECSRLGHKPGDCFMGFPYDEYIRINKVKSKGSH